MFHQIYFQPIVGGVMTQELRQTTKGAGEKVQDPQQILFYAFTFIYVVYLLYILNGNKELILHKCWKPRRKVVESKGRFFL